MSPSCSIAVLLMVVYGWIHIWRSYQPQEAHDILSNILMQKRGPKRLVTPTERYLCHWRAAASMIFLTQKPGPSFLNIPSICSFYFIFF